MKLTLEEKQKRLEGKPLFLPEDVIINSLGDILHYMFGRRGTQLLKLDKQGNKVPQKSGSARSIEDTYKLASGYFPEISYNQVFTAVESLYNHRLSHWWCYTVNRRVHGIIAYDINYFNKALDDIKLNYYAK